MSLLKVYTALVHDDALSPGERGKRELLKPLHTGTEMLRTPWHDYLTKSKLRWSIEISEVDIIVLINQYIWTLVSPIGPNVKSNHKLVLHYNPLSTTSLTLPLLQPEPHFRFTHITSCFLSPTYSRVFPSTYRITPNVCHVSISHSHSPTCKYLLHFLSSPSSPFFLAFPFFPKMSFLPHLPLHLLSSSSSPPTLTSLLPKPSSLLLPCLTLLPKLLSSLSSPPTFTSCWSQCPAVSNFYSVLLSPHFLFSLPPRVCSIAERGKAIRSVSLLTNTELLMLNSINTW